MNTIIIYGREIQVSVRPSRARKTVEVEYVSSKELVVKIPQNQNVDLEALLKKHNNLIEKKYRDYLSKIKILDNNTVLHKGIPHHIEIQKSVDIKEPRIIVQDGCARAFIEDVYEKKHGLRVMIRNLEANPDKIIDKQLLPSSIAKVHIGKIKINHLSGKKADQIIISL